MKPTITREKFDAQREIPRFATCPPLTVELRNKITETVFLHQNPQPADVLFVFGSWRDDKWNQVAELYTKGLAPIVYTAGRGHWDDKILSHLIRDNLVSHGVPREAIVVDELSMNTLEDAV